VLLGRQAGALPAIPLDLLHPLAQRLSCAAKLARDRSDRRPLRRVLGAVLLHEVDRALADLREYRLGRAMDVSSQEIRPRR
jgi:hypothetical protein